jgi:hypothetical protein
VDEADEADIGEAEGGGGKAEAGAEVRRSRSRQRWGRGRPKIQTPTAGEILVLVQYSITDIPNRTGTNSVHSEKEGRRKREREEKKELIREGTLVSEEKRKGVRGGRRRENRESTLSVHVAMAELSVSLHP